MTRRVVGAATSLLVALFGATLTGSAVTPHTQAQVNAAIAKAIVYLDTKQNTDGSFGSSFPIAETALAVIAYGVYDRGDVNSGILNPAEVTIVKKAVTYLLGQQDKSGTQTNGSWAPGTQYNNYSTGLALSALSFSKNGASATDIQTAVTNGRTASIAMFQGPTHNPTETCSTNPSDPSSHYCGGFTYDYGTQAADESNTAFGLTGLRLTGGVPANLKTLNAGWQHNIQALTSNAWWTASGKNDGGGSYVPGETYPPFTSNANDTGSMLFGFGFDGVAAADAGVVAGLKFAQDVLNVYEQNTATREGVYHSGKSEDGSCVIGTGSCDWQFDSDGGYHYSLWALSNGLAEYVTPNLSDTTNWFAKVADLLLGDQSTDGSWPVNGRDDATLIVSTGFSVFALGLATAEADDNYKPANTHITGTATGTPAQCPTVRRPAGTVTCFSVPGQKPTMTVYCTHSTSGGLTPAKGLGLFVVNPPVVFNDGYTDSTPKPCTDTLGGTETTVVSGTWKIGGIDTANDEASAEPNSGDKVEVVVPKAGAVINTSQGCRITVAPNGPYTAVGPYDDHSKFTVPVTNVPVIVTKLKSSCPLPAGVPLLSTFFATYIFNPGVSDGS